MGESGDRAFMRVIKGWFCEAGPAGARVAGRAVVPGGHRKVVGRNWVSVAEAVRPRQHATTRCARGIIFPRASASGSTSGSAPAAASCTFGTV